MSKSFFPYPTRLNTLAASLLMLAALLKPLPQAGVEGPRPPLVASHTALRSQLERRRGAIRATR